MYADHSKKRDMATQISIRLNTRLGFLERLKLEELTLLYNAVMSPRWTQLKEEKGE